eukprot:3250316-Prymnesium_polylepis.1
MAFWEDDTSSRTPSLHCKMNCYRFRTVKSKLGAPTPPRYITRVPKAAKRAAPPYQPSRARSRDGAPPTCRQ